MPSVIASPAASVCVVSKAMGIVAMVSGLVRSFCAFDSHSIIS